MNKTFGVELQTKEAVSVSEMSRMLGLSPSRLYQLMHAGLMPWPLYHIDSRRPFYPTDLQSECLRVRQTNFGINGKPILFYAPRHSSPPRVRRSPTSHATPAAPEEASALLPALRSLGLAAVSAVQIANALREMFPTGTAGLAQTEVTRRVFLRLRQQNSADNVRR